MSASDVAYVTEHLATLKHGRLLSDTLVFPKTGGEIIGIVRWQSQGRYRPLDMSRSALGHGPVGFIEAVRIVLEHHAQPNCTDTDSTRQVTLWEDA